MSSPIQDYAFLSDLQSAALVGRDGSIDWLTFPRFDSAACFAALLGTPKHGRWLLAPAGIPRRVERKYREGTLVLETVYTTDDLNVGGVTDPRALARRFWPIDEIALRYRQFVDTYRGVPDALERMRARHERMADAVFLPGALAVTVEFGSDFADDPLLPPELLPRPWPGRAARELLVRSRRLALRLREQHNRPALFRSFDDLIESVP